MNKLTETEENELLQTIKAFFKKKGCKTEDEMSFYCEINQDAENGIRIDILKPSLTNRTAKQLDSLMCKPFSELADECGFKGAYPLRSKFVFEIVNMGETAVSRLHGVKNKMKDIKLIFSQEGIALDMKYTPGPKQEAIMKNRPPQP